MPLEKINQDVTILLNKINEIVDVLKLKPLDQEAFDKLSAATKDNDWEKEFDEEFGWLNNEEIGEVVEEIKQFIRNLFK